MMGRMRFSVSAAVLMLALLPGCVGISFHGTEQVVRNPRGDFPVDSADASGALPTSVLLQRLGEPDDRVSLPTGAERWVYDGDMQWGGVVFWLLVPVPLLIPVG